MTAADLSVELEPPGTVTPGAVSLGTLVGAGTALGTGRTLPRAPSLGGNALRRPLTSLATVPAAIIVNRKQFWNRFPCPRSMLDFDMTHQVSESPGRLLVTAHRTIPRNGHSVLLPQMTVPSVPLAALKQ